MTEDCLQTLPRKLKIGAYDWAIILEDEGEGLCGQADFATNRLRLWPKNLNNPSHVVGIIFHECLHVVFDNQGLPKLKRVKKDWEELIILGFEGGLIAFFRDNPKFMTWMRKWLK